MRSSIGKRKSLREKTITSKIYDYMDALSWSNLIAISIALLSLIVLTYMWKSSDISKTGSGLSINTQFLIAYRNKLKTKLQTFFIIIGATFLIGLVLLFIRCFYGYLQQRKSENLSFHKGLTNKIKNELQKLHNSNSIEINDLRSRIFSNLDHRLTDSAWNNAIKYLELKDKQVQFGLTIRNGKECKTIKWTDEEVVHQSPLHNKTINNNSDSQLNCLKIRQMFDLSDTDNPFLEQMIEDAILEKLNNCCKVHDIQFDIENFCVYMRFDTEKDATVAFNKLNGWCFNRQMISIKFLRLQRYKIRFPNTLVESPFKA